MVNGIGIFDEIIVRRRLERAFEIVLIFTMFPDKWGDSLR
jgi:hypothetical protein